MHVRRTAPDPGSPARRSAPLAPAASQAAHDAGVAGRGRVPDAAGRAGRPRARARRRGRARRRRRAGARALGRHRSRAARGAPAGGVRRRRSRRVRRRALGSARRPGPRHRGARALAAALPLHPGPRLGVALRGLGRQAPPLQARPRPVRRVPARARAALLGQLRRREPGRRRAAARCGAGRSRTSPTSRAGCVRSSRAAAGSRIRRPPSPTARWCAAASRACARRGHGGDQMLLGETSPIGRETGRARDAPGAARRVHPHAAVHGRAAATGCGARRPRCAAARRPRPACA